MFDYDTHNRENKRVILKVLDEAQKLKALLILANEQSFSDNRKNHQVNYSNNYTQMQDLRILEVA